MRLNFSKSNHLLQLQNQIRSRRNLLIWLKKIFCETRLLTYGLMIDGNIKGIRKSMQCHPILHAYLKFIISAIDNCGRDIISIPSINNGINCARKFFKYQFGVSGVFYDLIFVSDRSCDNRKAQLLNNSSGYILLDIIFFGMT